MTSIRVQADVCSVVVGDADDKRIDAYLYDHSTSTTICEAKSLTYRIVTTVAFDFLDTDDPNPGAFLSHLVSEAKRLARYQCDRLASGLYGVYPAVGDFDNAQERLSEVLYG